MKSINLKKLISITFFASSICLINEHIFAQSSTTAPATDTKDSNLTNTNQTSPANETKAVQTSSFPKLMILPWHTPSVDADALQKTKTARTFVLEQLQKTFAPNAVKLDTIAPQNPKMQSARNILRDIYADNNTPNAAPLALFPLWTRIHDYDLFALVLIDPIKNTINKIQHRVIHRSEWQTVLQNKKYEDFFGPGFTELANAVQIKTQTEQVPDLAIIFRDQTASFRTNEVDRAIISALLVFGNDASASQTFLVINNFNTELITTIQKFYMDKTQMRKANRELITRITYEKPPVDIKLPLTLSMNIRATDAVFGQTLPWSWTEPMTLSAKTNKTLEIKTSNRLVEQLSQEKEALRRDELPQISKIVGAWAYIDKGRAWGLQMNDRLTGNESPSKIKGHIVSYFGPELKLKSPRGWPIHEGAIVFIRKGQKELKIGQTLTYDGMKVPTPWPPVSSEQKP